MATEAAFPPYAGAREDVTKMAMRERRPDCVHSGGGGSVSDSVADAGPDRTIEEGQTVALDGSGSRGSIVTTSGGLPSIDNYSCPFLFGSYLSLPREPYANLVENGDAGRGAWRVFTSRGDLVVLNQATNRVAVYNPSGNLLRRFYQETISGYISGQIASGAWRPTMVWYSWFWS